MSIAELSPSLAETMALDRRIQGVPTLVLANKQDQPNSVPVEQVKDMFNQHVVNLNISESAVLPISALKG